MCKFENRTSKTYSFVHEQCTWKYVLKSWFLLFELNSKAAMLFSNRQEKVSMDHFKEIEIRMFKHLRHSKTMNKRSISTYFKICDD